MILSDSIIIFLPYSYLIVYLCKFVCVCKKEILFHFDFFLLVLWLFFFKGKKGQFDFDIMQFMILTY